MVASRKYVSQLDATFPFRACALCNAIVTLREMTENDSSTTKQNIYIRLHRCGNATRQTKEPGEFSSQLLMEYSFLLLSTILMSFSRKIKEGRNILFCCASLAQISTYIFVSHTLAINLTRNTVRSIFQNNCNKFLCLDQVQVVTLYWARCIFEEKKKTFLECTQLAVICHRSMQQEDFYAQQEKFMQMVLIT